MKKIHRLLIANRAEIARRIIRTAHRMGLQTVAVYAEPDAGALHVREATFACALGGAASADSYLRIDKLISAARTSGADAVHPGYGFLSENADFAQAVTDAGLAWVGPPPDAIRALGSKSGAKRLAQSLGVPCLPGYQGEDQSDVRLATEAGRIGYPVMVKAAAGGGGRGMRLVAEPAQLLAAVRSARSEAQSAFGNGELLLERALLHPRHVEVQVFADAHGHGIHLGERDCSVQRRHQKIIEETPSPAVDAALRERMGRCAVELALAAGYVGAGTVEFLLEPAAQGSAGREQGAQGAGESESQQARSGQADPQRPPAFYLMEMNTRLQVEHPVTEAVTGLDLVEWQLRVAQGEPLPLAQQDVRFSGHAIEVRLCAEDEDFTPHAGTVQHFLPPLAGKGRGGGTLRFDHALHTGLHVPPHYDSLLGKLIAHAPTRGQAIAHLAAALDRTELLGLPTNRRFLAACLRHPRFLAGQALIPFLAGQGDAIRDTLRQDEKHVAQACALAALFPSGAAPALPSPFERPVRVRHRSNTFELRVRESDGLDTPRCTAVALGAGRWHVQSAAIDLFLEDLSYQPAPGRTGAATGTGLRAPFNGKVIAIHAIPGAAVARGDALLVIESMKLEHTIAAPHDAVVETVRVEPGQQVATSQLLVNFEVATP